MKLVYNEKLMKYIILFESLTKVKVKDVYIKDDYIMFIIEKGGMFRAVGKNGANVKRIESMLKRKVKIIEYSEDICKFTSNLIYPIKVNNVDFNDARLEITTNDSKSKGLLIGRERKNLKGLKEVLSRYFKVDEIIIK